MRTDPGPQSETQTRRATKTQSGRKECQRLMLDGMNSITLQSGRRHVVPQLPDLHMRDKRAHGRAQASTKIRRRKAKPKALVSVPEQKGICSKDVQTVVVACLYCPDSLEACRVSH
eukprot:4793038-Pleurochrysis_carterae.AAC.8